MRRKLFAEHVGFPKMIPGIQEKYQDIAPYQGCHVQQWHGLCLERRAQGDLGPKCINSPLKNLLRGLRFEFSCEPLDLTCRKHAKIIPVIILLWMWPQQST